MAPSAVKRLICFHFSLTILIRIVLLRLVTINHPVFKVRAFFGLSDSGRFMRLSVILYKRCLSLHNTLLNLFHIQKLIII